MTRSSRPTQTIDVDLDHKWTPYQYETLQALKSGRWDLVVLRTGYGGGKSVIGSRWVHRTALQRGGRHLVLAPAYSQGGPATYRVFFEQLPGEDTVPNDDTGDPRNSPIVAGYHQVKRRLTYVNGAIVLLGSADKWNRYAGAEFATIWGDEVAHYEHTDLYQLHEMLVSRQRTEVGPNVTLWTSTGAGYNQYYDITEREVGPDDEPLSWADRMKVIVASAMDNPFLREKEKMRAQFEGTEKEDQALHGGFSAATGLVYSDFSRTVHVVREDFATVLADNETRFYGYDAGWKHPRVLLEIATTSYGQYLVVDCFYETGAHVGDPDDPDEGTALAWLEEKPKGRIFCEHAPADIDKFKKAGWRAEKAHKDIDGGIEAVRERLEREKLGEDELGRPGLLVSDRCAPLIQEFLSYKEDHVGKGDADDHALDALRYALHSRQMRPSVEFDGPAPQVR